MTSQLLVRVELTHANGLPEDSAYMDFVVHDTFDEVITDGPLVVTQAFDHFFNTYGIVQVGATNNAHGTYEFISGAVERGAGGVKLKYYDVTAHQSGTPAGSPVAVDSFTLSGAEVNDGLPREVASVITLRGEDWDQVAVSQPGGAPGPAGDVRPRQRRSGRIYFGPLNTSALEFDAKHAARVSVACRTVVLQRMFDLQTELVAAGYQLLVWSRRNAAFYPLVRVEMDDAFDIQRSRGEDATVRDAVAVPTLA